MPAPSRLEVAFTPLRHYVMGEASFERAARGKRPWVFEKIAGAAALAGTSFAIDRERVLPLLAELDGMNIRFDLDELARGDLALFRRFRQQIGRRGKGSGAEQGEENEPGEGPPHHPPLREPRRPGEPGRVEPQKADHSQRDGHVQKEVHEEELRGDRRIADDFGRALSTGK